MTYDYFANMREDVQQAIDEYCDYNTCEIGDCNFDALYDSFFVDDGVTGNASGSYTFNAHIARDYVEDNHELLRDAYKEFGCIDSFGEDFVNEEWEKMDVTIRCYLLGEVLAEFVDY